MFSIYITLEQKIKRADKHAAWQGKFKLEHLRTAFEKNLVWS